MVEKRFFIGRKAQSMASIREVARVAGVSPSTVSEVLNNSARARIGLDTQERVRRVAMELDYRPNSLARSLSSGRTQTVGLLISGLRNPFFVALAESIEEAVRDSGYQALMDAAPSHRGSYREHGKLSRWPVDGALMWANPTQTLCDVLGEGARNTPVVYIGGEPREESDSIWFDLESGATEAARLLIKRGTKRIAHLVPYPELRDSPIEPRSRAFHRVCEESGLGLEVLVCSRREETLEAGWVAGQELAALPATKRPQAVLCHNDVLALGLCAGLRRGGVQIPADVAVIGCDGIEEGRFLERPLTTIQIPIAELGRRAFQMLLHRLNGNAPRPSVVLPTHLHLGETA